MVGIGDVGIRRRQNDLPDRFDRDAIVPGVEPDQRLTFRRRTVGPRVDIHGLVGGILRRRVERILDLSFRIDVMFSGLGVSTHRARPVAGRCGLRARRTSHRHGGASQQQLQKRATMVLPDGHLLWVQDAVGTPGPRVDANVPHACRETAPP